MKTEVQRDEVTASKAMKLKMGLKDSNLGYITLDQEFLSVYTLKNLKT